MTNPQAYRYTKDHEWVSLKGDIATIGITYHAQELLTDIVYVELPKIGQVVKQHAPAGVVESVKSVSDVFCPVSGEVIEINTILQQQPELLNLDPYQDGWIARIKVSSHAEIDTLMSASEYEALIAA